MNVTRKLLRRKKMKITRKLLRNTLTAVCFAALFMAAFAACDDSIDKGGNEGNAFDKYYEGSFRDNRNGTVEVVNNTSHDLLIFLGTEISLNFLVGGVRVGAKATINFSTESDYQIGGISVLNAVRQSEFEASGAQSTIDNSAFVVYGEGKKFIVSITSTTEGDYHYMVSNTSAKYGLELRENSPVGQKIVYLRKGEQQRIIQTTSANYITLYPVWIAFNTQTSSVYTFEPTDVLSAMTISPKPTSESASSYMFKLDELAFTDSITVPFSVVKITNNTSVLQRNL